MNTPLWFSNLVFWSAQVSLLALAAAPLPHLLQVRQPRVLLSYWRALLGISLVLPFVQPWHRMPGITAIAFSPDTTGAGAVPPSALPVSHWHFPGVQVIAQIVGIILLAGIAARFVVLVLGLLKLRQLRRASFPIASFAESAAVLEEMRAHVNTVAEFRFSADVDSPVTFGFAAPVILLPERFPFMDARFQSAIACHELLHVRRHDWSHHLAEEAIRCAFWFHPAIVWFIGRVRLAREQVVDFEVIRLTKARKPYLEALLEFTTGHARPAAIPAPPFLCERQFAERVALMLKEVRMSRTRLIASLTAIASCLALAATLAVWAFPLKAAPRTPAQNAIPSAVAGRAPGSATSGTTANSPAQGAKGGVNVDRSSLWIDTVKRGSMLRQVRGLGLLVRPEDSANLVARVTLPDFMLHDVQPNQNVVVDTRKGLVKGHVSHIGPPASDGNRNVDIALDSPLPEGVGADSSIHGTIDIETLEDVLYVGRPIHGTPNTSISLFKMVSDGTGAVRTHVKFGRASVQTIEVLDGLKVGDKIILSDMSNWDNVDRIQVK
jgi:beta-lactamase regulating signal transducer with metallopeptidase domain